MVKETGRLDGKMDEWIDSCVDVLRCEGRTVSGWMAFSSFFGGSLHTGVFLLFC